MFALRHSCLCGCLSFGPSDSGISEPSGPLGPLSALLIRLSLPTMINPNQMRVLLFVCFKMSDETNLSTKLPVADRT